MITQAARIQQDIDKLITSLRPNANKQLKTDIQSYFKRLNSSSSGFRQNQSAPQIKDKILKRVTQKADSKTVFQCHQTINNIMGSSQITRKADVLKMLLKISQLSNGSSNSNMFSVSDKIEELNLTKQTLSNNTMMNNTGSNSVFTKPKRTLTLQQLQPLRNRGSIQQGITQIDIIKQITYVLQNIDASMIKHTQQDTYQLQANVNVSETVRSIVSQLCEIGWLYKKIISLLKNTGSIQKALTVAVHQQLNQYYRWLAIIQHGIQQNSINLRTLICWSYEPMQKLKWLALVLSAIQPYSGCQIISIVNSYRPHGQQPINNLLNRLLGHMIQPLLQCIHNWMYKGELIDDNKQFFVEQKQKVNQVTEWFEKYRLVENNIPNILDKQSAQMIFNAGKTIYFLKNRCKCNYSISIPFINQTKILNYDICESSNILSTQFKKWLTLVYENLSCTLVAQLKQRYHLKYHLQSMKHFYLMGKGDFIQQLVDTLKQEMSKPKHTVYEHTLDGYITDAITKSFQDFRIDAKNGQPQKMQIQGQKTIKSRIQQGGSQKMIMLKGSKLYQNNKKQIDADNSYRSNILYRLIAKKVDFAQTAWDSFNFQYSMERIEPLYSIMSPDLVENYQRIFQFLWKIKRIEHVLKQVWMINQKQYPKTQKNKNFLQFSRMLHRCHILRSNMCHFVSTFYGYLMIAIESAWDRFSISLQKSQSLDEIIKQHRALHSELSSITFSSTNKKNLRDSLMNTFKSIQQFKNLQSKILVQYSEFYENMRKYDNRKKIMAKGMLNFEQDELEIPHFDEVQLIKRLQQINEIYDKTFKTFYENLKKQGEQTSILVFRLDFSEYFAMRQIQDRL